MEVAIYIVLCYVAYHVTKISRELDAQTRIQLALLPKDKEKEVKEVLKEIGIEIDIEWDKK